MEMMIRDLLIYGQSILDIFGFLLPLSYSLYNTLIEKNDLVRFLSYSDKNLKTTLSTIRTLDDITDSDSDTDSDDKSYMQSLQNLDKWKLKYYRLKYAIRIKMINDMLCKHC